MKALCVFSTILGHSAVAERLTRALGSVKNLEPVYILINSEDYSAYRAPRWARLTDPWEGEYVARRIVLPLNARDFDLLLVNTWELAVALRETAQLMPAAMVMDAMPATIDAQLRRQGRTGLKRWLAQHVHQRAFGKAVREFDLFLRKSSNCAESLQHDLAFRPTGAS